MAKKVIAFINADLLGKKRLREAEKEKHTVQRQWKELRARRKSRERLNVARRRLAQSRSSNAPSPSRHRPDSPQIFAQPLRLGDLVIQHAVPTPKRVASVSQVGTPTSQIRREDAELSSSCESTPERVELPVGSISPRTWKELDDRFTLHDLKGNTVIDILLSIIRRQNKALAEMWGSPAIVAVLSMEREETNPLFVPSYDQHRALAARINHYLQMHPDVQRTGCRPYDELRELRNLF